ncbi:hypothetical protein ACFL5V_05040 [Fibrobacterota bacterium]
MPAPAALAGDLYNVFTHSAAIGAQPKAVQIASPPDLTGFAAATAEHHRVQYRAYAPLSLLKIDQKYHISGLFFLNRVDF